MVHGSTGFGSTSPPDARRRKSLSGPQTRQEAAASWKQDYERLQNFLPLLELPHLKRVAPFYYEWLSHPPADSWWDWAELRNKYDRVHAAVLNFSGWYDEAYSPDGATTNLNGLLAGHAEKDPRTHTLIGPWTHGGQHESKSGERDFGPAAPRLRCSNPPLLVFDTIPLQTDTELTGPIRAEIFVSADAPDFDLWVRLLDVAPDGTAFNLMSPGLDVLRASYRNASLKPELLTPSKVYLLTLDRMLTSNGFRSGHHIRVQTSAAFSPHFSRNLQTGESEITSFETQLCHIRIYHDAEHSSRIVLPIIPRAKQ
jgi:predicted acyl esterase